MNDIFTRTVAFEPSTFDGQRGTVQAIISAGTDVPRRDLQGPYLERLSMNPNAWSVAGNTIPVLKDHRRDVDSLIGRADSIRFENGRALATIRISESEPTIRQKVGDGTLTDVSIGFTVPKWREFSENGTRVREAEQIVVHEVSFTPIGADPQAKTRSQSSIMNEQLQTQIRSAATLLGLPSTWSETYITTNPEATIEQARAAAIAEMGTQAPTINNRQPGIVTRDGNEGLATRMADGLFSRVNPRHKPEAGREFAYSRIEDLARTALSIRGLSTLGSGADVITRALQTTSDFPNVFAEYFNKAMLELRGTDRTPVEQVFKHSTASDFRARHILEMSDGQMLEKVNEKGEVRFGSFSDKELANYKIASYAKGYGLTFHTLVNDDMAALSDSTGKATRGARTWFADFLVSTIVNNPKLADNVAVFHANHLNLAAAGSVPSEASLQEGKLAMRMQKDANGVPINAAPKYIVIPAAIEATVDKLMATLYPSQPSEAIVSARSLTPITEPRLDAKGQSTPWYLFADPNEAGVFEFSELSGFTGPQVDTENGFDYLGVRIRVVWHLGAGAIDSRGAWKNPGA